MSPLDRARDALQAIPPDLPRDEWVRAGMAAHAAGLSFDDFDAWSARADNYKAQDACAVWRSFKPGKVGTATLFHMARAAGCRALQDGRLTPAERADLARRQLQANADRQQAQQAAWAAEAPRLTRLWAACRSVLADGNGDDPVTLYLRHRLVLTADEALEVPQVLRLHPGLDYFHDGQHVGRWPAMVAAVINLAGELVALHRTWLTPDGRKASTPGPVKKLSRTAGPVMGGCIRLAWLGRAAGFYGSSGGIDRTTSPSGPLGIAEGIETAIAAGQASGIPTVAAYSAGALAAWCWPAGLRRLVIFADHDPAGGEAAGKLRQRARAAGLSVNVLTPSESGTDWCDVWAQRGAVSMTASEGAA